MEKFEIFGRLVVAHHNLEDAMLQCSKMLDKVGIMLQNSEETFVEDSISYSIPVSYLSKVSEVRRCVDEYARVLRKYSGSVFGEIGEFEECLEQEKQ